MKPLPSALAASLLLTLAAPVHSAPGGQIATLPMGRYRCEAPGGPHGMAPVRVPAEDFEIVSASSYQVARVRGSYLLTGDRMVMTSGAFRGKRYDRTSFGIVRPLLPDGRQGPVRCVLTASTGN